MTRFTITPAKSPPPSYPEKINCILYWCEVICHICEERIEPGDFAADHHPRGRWLGAGNEPHEMKPSHKWCNAEKGNKRETKESAKTNRLQKARLAHERGEKKASRMASRPFDKRYRKKMDGTVERRT